MSENKSATGSSRFPAILNVASAIVDYFANKGNVPTIEQLIPAEEDIRSEVQARAPSVKPVNLAIEAATAKNDDDLDDLNAKTGFKATVASDLLFAVSRLNINYKRRLTPSTYIPCSLQMFFRVHVMNESLCKHYGFLSNCPNYHPYLLRLYCGILFWIQCIRASVHAGTATLEQVNFLRSFLDTFPPESLPIPGPLLLIFKSLCASQPENPDFGLVTPTVIMPRNVRRSNFVHNAIGVYGMPNIPGIMALIDDLTDTLNEGVYPSQGQHIPVGDDATVFGTAAFTANATRSARLKWSLVTPGIEYPCEAGTQLHRTYANHADDLNYPELADNDPISTLEYYFSFENGFAWFGNVRDVASAVSSYYAGSRTLSDCPVFGYNVNQYIIHYADTAADLPRPTRIADSRSLFPLNFHVETSAREEQRANLYTAASVQTNVVFPTNHPVASTFGQLEATRNGPFWDVWPTTSTVRHTDGQIRLRNIVRDSIINKR